MNVLSKGTVSYRFGQPCEFLLLFSQPFSILIIFYKKKQIRNVLLGINNMAADINSDFILNIFVTNVDFLTFYIRDCPFKKILRKPITKYIWELKYCKLLIMHPVSILKSPVK